VTDSDDKETKESLLEFPCQFPIKMMGKSSVDFRSIAISLVETHTGVIATSAIRSAPSSNGRFVSITVEIEAQSQAQLDAIYQDLSASQDVLVAL